MWTLPIWYRRKTFATSLKTFYTVFPHTSVWLVPINKFFVFVATPNELRIDQKKLEIRMAQHPKKLGNYPLFFGSIQSLLNTFLFDEKVTQKLVSTEDLDLFTMKYPTLEFLVHTDQSDLLGTKWIRKMRRPIPR